jgi:transposase
MKKQERRQYTEEFKKETVALIEKSGKSKAQISRELGINDQNISRWCQLYGKQANNADNEVPSLQEFLAMKAELRYVKEERDILKKALNIFSRNG